MRSKPVCSIWARMKPMMTSTACAGSIGRKRRRPVRLAHAVVGRCRQIGPFGDDAVDLAPRELEALVGKERQAVALHAHVIGVDGSDHQRLLPERRLGDGRAVGGQDARATPEGEPLLVADPVAEGDRHRAEQRVGVLHLVPAGDGGQSRPRCPARGTGRRRC